MTTVTHTLRWKLFFCLIANFCFASSYYFFTPPVKWKLANPKYLSPMVEMCFLGKGMTSFHPSINIATEEIDISYDEYLKVVKKLHQDDPNIEFKELGKIKTKAGTASLFELTSNSKFGVIKMLQSVYAKNNKAYVLTGSMHISEYKTMSKTILFSLKSFEIIDNLLNAITNVQKKQQLQNVIVDLNNVKSIKEKKWKKFEKFVTKEFQELGLYWQILIIKDTCDKLFEIQK